MEPHDAQLSTLGSLASLPALEHPELLAPRVATALAAWSHGHEVAVVEIDPAFADTAALTQAYDLPLTASANCVVVAGRRGGEERIAACVVRADTRADVNNVVKRRLDVRKASFLPTDRAVAETEMEYGGITPLGLPNGWRVFLGAEVVKIPVAMIGSGVRQSKLLLAGWLLSELPSAALVVRALERSQRMDSRVDLKVLSCRGKRLGDVRGLQMRVQVVLTVPRLEGDEDSRRSGRLEELIRAAPGFVAAGPDKTGERVAHDLLRPRLRRNDGDDLQLLGHGGSFRRWWVRRYGLDRLRARGGNSAPAGRPEGSPGRRASAVQGALVTAVSGRLHRARQACARAAAGRRRHLSCRTSWTGHLLDA
jgi:prolyl-tRNA editing enzyme YbaK/EbsC (Cys-tRNA(Pro) deacylase)